MARLMDVRQGCGVAPQHQQSLARDPTRQGAVVLARYASGDRAQGPAVRQHWCTTMPRFIMVEVDMWIGVPVIEGTLICPISF